MLIYGVYTYTKKAVTSIARIYVCLPKEETRMPVTERRPEIDVTPLLVIDGHCKFQILLGMSQRMVTIDKPYLCQVLSSLNRFGAYSREDHLDLIVHCFGYAKTIIHNKIDIDYGPMQFNRTEPKFTKLIPKFVNDYPEAIEEMDLGFPSSFVPLLQSTFLMISDHACNLKTRAITGLIGMLGVHM